MNEIDSIKLIINKNNKRNVGKNGDKQGIKSERMEVKKESKISKLKQ